MVSTAPSNVTRTPKPTTGSSSRAKGTMLFRNPSTDLRRPEFADGRPDLAAPFRAKSRSVTIPVRYPTLSTTRTPPTFRASIMFAASFSEVVGRHTTAGVRINSATLISCLLAVATL
jgi:hypothetical protein